VVIEEKLALNGSENYHFGVGGPGHTVQLVFKFFAPVTGAIDPADDDGAIQVDNGDFLAIG
jgi:hypothetical protein